MTNLSDLILPWHTNANHARYPMRVHDGNSNLNKLFTQNAGNKHTMMMQFCGISSSTARRRLFRIESPSNYSSFSIEIYASNESFPNQMVMFQADSSNNALLYGSSASFVVTDEDLYTVFFASDRDAGTYLFVINGVVYSGWASTNVTGTIQSGANAQYYLMRSSSGQYVRGAANALVYTEQYLTNWEDFMFEDGTVKKFDTVNWSQFGGTQPMICAPDGANNLGSLGAFTWTE